MYFEPIECTVEEAEENKKRQINPNDVWCNSKPNPYMPYEYYSTQLKSATENDDLVPVDGTIRTELYNIIKDRLEHGGIEYHECDSTRIDKK